MSLLLVLLVATLLSRHHPRRVFRLLVATLAGLILFSCPIFTDSFRRSWENTFPSQPVTEYPQRDAIVVLGGTMGKIKFPRYRTEEIFGARVLMAWRLFMAGKAPVIVCSGGVPYADIHGLERTEADDMAELLIELGIPAEKIIRERLSRTTFENARYTMDILGPQNRKNILLATTAIHLKRATALFHKAGFEVTPVPNTWYSSVGISFEDFLPDSGMLGANSNWLKEVVGYYFFHLLGKA